jgi:two-component system response regulator RegX3
MSIQFSGDGGTILVVEDEATLAEALRYNLEREGFRVIAAANGRTGLEMSGFDLCRMLRSESNVPILILTARDSEADKVAGLELGADDYMTKPFSMRELISRVRAQLRRAGMFGPPVETVISGGEVELDPERHEARVRGELVEFTPKEFALLEALLSRKGRLVSRGLLIDEVWGSDYVGDAKTLDVHIKRLRKKIEVDPGKPLHLLTVRGLGYKFVD